MRKINNLFWISVFLICLIEASFAGGFEFPKPNEDSEISKIFKIKSRDNKIIKLIARFKGGSLIRLKMEFPDEKVPPIEYKDKKYYWVEYKFIDKRNNKFSILSRFKNYPKSNSIKFKNARLVSNKEKKEKNIDTKYNDVFFIDTVNGIELSVKIPNVAKEEGNNKEVEDLKSE